MTGTGSSKPSNEPEQKEEKQSKDDKDSQDKDLYISVMFSVIPYEMMTSTGSSKVILLSIPPNRSGKMGRLTRTRLTNPCLLIARK